MKGGGIQAKLFDIARCFNLKRLKDKGSTTTNVYPPPGFSAG